MDIFYPFIYLFSIFSCFIYLFILLNTSKQLKTKNIALSAEQDVEPSEIVVSTDLGKIRGSFFRSSLNRRFAAFRGIRFAQPPVGDLRFRDPVPVEPWEGEFDATMEGPRCPQPPVASDDLTEDCLRLNVYTHELPAKDTHNTLRPVVVFLYPSGFYIGSDQSREFGPEYLMNTDIVLVTNKIRLSTLGFLSTGTADAPGNAGLKDQVVALKWVKNHISRFGGDPDSITLIGGSAGGYHIALLMVSPMSRGLFHKAFLLGPSFESQRKYGFDQIDVARRQARLLNCTDDDISQMVQCLKTKDFLDFAATMSQMFEFASGYSVLTWRPVIEKDFGQERFLIRDPIKAIEDGDFMKIPVIAGITTNEFASIAIRLLTEDALRVLLDQHWDEIAPIVLQIERNMTGLQSVIRELRDKYLGQGRLSLNKSERPLEELISDALIGFGTNRFVCLTSRETSVYYYHFSYQGRYSTFHYPQDKPYGVVHTDELIYFFHEHQVAPMFTEQDPEFEVMRRMTALLERLAYTGNPNNPNDTHLQKVEWTPFDAQNKLYLDIGLDVMGQKLYEERYALWRRLFPIKEDC